MSNSDKNIIISPSTGSTDTKPSIQFTGAGNSTINLTVGDTNFIDFNSDNKSLFSVEHTSGNEDILVITNNYANTSARFLSDGSTGLGLLSGTAGYVGIGTASAEEKLHVKGNLKVEGNILPSGQVINPNSKTDIKDATVTQDEFYNFYQDNKFNGDSIHTYKFSPDGTKSIVVDTSHFIHGVTNSPAYALQGSEIDSTFNIRSLSNYSSFVGYSAYVKDDGSAVYFSGAKNDGTRVIAQFDLTTNWDVSTIGFTTEYAFGKVLDSFFHDAITFSADGSKLVFNGKGASYDAIAQMDLSTPWSIDTLSGISSTYLLNQVDRIAESTILKPDGTKAYVLGSQTNDIIELDLDAPYQIGSAKYNGVSQDLGGDYHDIKFKPDGTILFAVNSGNTVYSWTLSSAWDLSTLSSSTSLNASAYDSDIEGLVFKPDGTELYLSGGSSKKVHQYTLSGAWDLATASYTGELETGSLINNGVADSFGLYDLRGENLGITTQKSRTPKGIGISTDGTRLYVNDLWGQYITTWDLGTPWDVSTGISSTTDTLAVVGDDTGGIYFDDTGSHLVCN
jgi:sugar lactone lactonase YvrE